MPRVIKTSRIYDDANSEVRIYRPGMTISGPDAQSDAALGNVEDDADEKAAKPASNKSLSKAPENKSAKGKE